MFKFKLNSEFQLQLYLTNLQKCISHKVQTVVTWVLKKKSKSVVAWVVVNLIMEMVCHASFKYIDTLGSRKPARFPLNVWLNRLLSNILSCAIMRRWLVCVPVCFVKWLYYVVVFVRWCNLSNRDTFLLSRVENFRGKKGHSWIKWIF